MMNLGLKKGKKRGVGLKSSQRRAVEKGEGEKQNF